MAPFQMEETDIPDEDPGWVGGGYTKDGIKAICSQRIEGLKKDLLKDVDNFRAAQWSYVGYCIDYVLYDLKNFLLQNMK